jgi:hypothetical protein
LYVRYATRCDYVQATELVRLVRKHEEEVLEGFRERLDKGGQVLVHEDALSAEDVARVNALEGTDIGPDELLSFLHRHAELTGEFTVYGETYFLLSMPGAESDHVPLEDQQDSDSYED